MDACFCFSEYQPTGWPVAFTKTILCLEEMKKGREIIFWLDADTLIVDHKTDLRDAFKGCDKEMIGAVRHPGPPIHLNIGVMLIKNGPTVRKLFGTILEHGPDGHPWWDQSVFLKLIKKPEFEDLPIVIDNKWNSTYKVNESLTPIIKAWHGINPPVKRLGMMLDELSKVQ